MSELLEKADKSKKEEEEDDGDDAPAVEEESTAEFVPIVKLKQLSEIITHEEDEDAVHTIRVKMFEFGETLLDKGTGIKSWKEKGVGDLKLLKDRKTGKTRLLMRQEKTLKVCANFYCDHRIGELKAHAGSDKAWVVNAPADFSDPAEAVNRVFAIKFGTPEACSEFKTKFDAAQAEMKAIFESKDKASAAADAAADALAKVSIEEEKPKEEATAEKA